MISDFWFVRGMQLMSQLSGLFCRPSGGGLCVQLIEVHHVHTQSKCWRGLDIPRRKLFAVMVEIEIKWVFRIGINQNQVRIAHCELAEAQHGAAISHKIARAGEMSWASAISKHLNDLSIFDLYTGQLAANLWRRKNLLRVKDYVVFLRRDAADLLCVDQVRKFHAEEVHHALHRQMGGFNVF